MKVGQFPYPMWSLKGYWKLSNANDSSGNSYDLTNNGSVAFSTCLLDSGAGSFTGTKSLYTTDITNMDLGDATGFAIHVFVKLNSLPVEGTKQRVWDFRSTYGNARQSLCEFSNNGTDQYIYCMGSSFTFDNLQTGKWYSIWFTYVSPDSKIFIDGENQDIGNYTTAGSSNRLILGNNSDTAGTAPLLGYLDEFALFSVAKTDSYIRKWESYIHGREF